MNNSNPVSLFNSSVPAFVLAALTPALLASPISHNTMMVLFGCATSLVVLGYLVYSTKSELHELTIEFDQKQENDDHFADSVWLTAK